MLLVHIFKGMVLLGIYWEQIDLLGCFSCVLFNRALLARANVAEELHQCMTVVLNANKATSKVDVAMEQVISLYILVCSRLLVTDSWISCQIFMKLRNDSCFFHLNHGFIFLDLVETDVGL